MLKLVTSRRIVLKIIKGCRTYLSDEFKCANGLEHIQVSSLFDNDEKSLKANLEGVRVEQMLSNRLQSFRTQTSSLESVLVISHVVIKHFLSQNNINDLISILQNPRKYGIFLDDYTGCYLLNHLFSLKEFLMAAHVAVILMLHGKVQSQLTQVMIVNAIFMYSYAKTEIEEEANQNDVNEKHVPMRYSRTSNCNNSDKDQNFNYIIGKILLELTNNIDNSVQLNLYALGLVLTKRYGDAIEFLEKNSQVIHKELLQKILQFAENDTTSNTCLISSIRSAINGKASLIHNPFDVIIYSFTKKVAGEKQFHMIENQKILYKRWLTNIYDKINADKRNEIVALRLKNAEMMYRNLKSKEEYVRFFKKDDYYNLQIANINKKKYYPKTWFGKKKQPRIIDKNYVPPEIKRIDSQVYNNYG